MGLLGLGSGLRTPSWRRGSPWGDLTPPPLPNRLPAIEQPRRGRAHTASRRSRVPRGASGSQRGVSDGACVRTEAEFTGSPRSPARRGQPRPCRTSPRAMPTPRTVGAGSRLARWAPPALQATSRRPMPARSCDGPETAPAAMGDGSHLRGRGGLQASGLTPWFPLSWVQPLLPRKVTHRARAPTGWGTYRAAAGRARAQRLPALAD